MRAVAAPLAVVALLGGIPGVLHAQAPVSRNGSFTDSTGRTIWFRVSTRSDWNTSEPRGVLVFFHGNNYGTEDEILRTRWVNAEQVFDLGLAVAVVASPGSGGVGDAWQPPNLFGWDIGKSGTRSWAAKPDSRLIHELLQSGFNSRFAVDHDRIIFYGGSQGACFLNDFLHLYAGVYGGGFHLHCGCFWGPSSSHYNFTREKNPWEPTHQWTPHGASYVGERLRVFVEATTEDHLHSQSVDMAEYYSQILGLDTRWDLEAPGGHCDGGSTPRSEIWEWLSSVSVPPRPALANDADGDGVPNAVDPDDDNDGAPDVIDAVPLEPRGWLDTDGDGIGNFADRDADGDGADNAEDPFPLDPREWRDNDADGIGDTLDADDDNDGLPDSTDPDPLHGTRNDQLSFHRVESGVFYVSPRAPVSRHPAASVHDARPADVIYPEPRGNRQSYQFIELGDNAARFEIMIDRLDRDEPCEAVLLPAFCSPDDPETPYPYFENYIDWIHVDRNRNRDLTDDGPPLIRAANTADIFSSPRPTYTSLEVPYASGDVLPYGMLLSTWGELSKGAFYVGASTWMGYVKTPAGEPVLLATIDANVDGLFNTGEAPDDFDGPVRDLRDITCIDFDRNGVLNECERTEDYTGERVNPVYPGQLFELDGRRWTISVAPSGHSVAWFPVDGNRPPETVRALAPLAIGIEDSPVSVDISRAFRDPDGDPLTHGASSSAPAVASVAVSGSTVTVTPVAEGTATVTVTATDPVGLSASQSFTVTVVAPIFDGAFTDDPLRPGVTPVRAVHFTELRERINALREANDLGPFRWTDPVLRAGATPVRLLHLLELRSALEAAYAAAGRPVPRWTDPAPARGVTSIRAVHLTELRAAVVALE